MLLEKLIDAQLVKRVLAFYGTPGLLPGLQELASGTYLEPAVSNPRLILPLPLKLSLFFLYLSTKVFYIFLLPQNGLCPAHLCLLGCFLIISGKEYKLRSSPSAFCYSK
jgi:hypothetical protein